MTVLTEWLFLITSPHLEHFPERTCNTAQSRVRKLLALVKEQ